MKENKCNIFYARTSISLVYILSLIKQLNFSSRNNILILNINKACIHPNFIKKIYNSFSNKFNKIFYVNFNNDHLKGNIIQRIISRNKNIKKVKKLSIFNKLNDYKVANYYGCGDEFDTAFYSKYKFFKKVDFHFLEHGYGNLINTIIFKPNIRNIIFYNFIKLCNFFRLLNIYPLKYKNFYGVLGKNFKTNINFYINNLKVNYTYIKTVNAVIKKIIRKLSFKISFKKKGVFLNFSTLESPSGSERDLDNLIEITASLIKKNNFCYYTSHPRNRDKIKSIKYVNQKLSKFKIKINHIEYKKFDYLPAELLVCILNTKKVISNLSSIPLNLSIIKKDIKNYVFLDYSLKYPNLNHGPAHNISCKKYYLKYFRSVNFIK